jgi:hypothetical protein
MNMNNLDPILAADAWNEYMPIWTRVELSDPASVVLADFLEMRNQVILDPNVLSGILMRTLRTKMWENMTKQTRQRLLLLVRQLVPEFSESFPSVWDERLSEKERWIFSLVLQGTEIELPPPPPSRSFQELEFA